MFKSVSENVIILVYLCIYLCIMRKNATDVFYQQTHVKVFSNHY